MNHREVLNDHFYHVPTIKVFLLGIASAGIYLMYWYFLQYAQSNNSENHPAKSALKSIIPTIFSISLFTKINKLLYEKGHTTTINGPKLYISKLIFTLGIVLLTLFPLLNTILSWYSALIITIFIEAVFAGLLQFIINQYQQKSAHQSTQPWAKMELFHYLSAIAGITLLFTFPYIYSTLHVLK